MSKTFIISEIGVNHNNNIELAKKLIDKSKTAVCDVVKFQTFKAQILVKPNTEKVKYQKNRAKIKSIINCEYNFIQILKAINKLNKKNYNKTTYFFWPWKQR